MSAPGASRRKAYGGVEAVGPKAELLLTARVVEAALSRCAPSIVSLARLRVAGVALDTSRANRAAVRRRQAVRRSMPALPNWPQA